MLTGDQAIQIYQFKVLWSQHPANCIKDMPCRSIRGQSTSVSKQFGVSSRTVRDIWNRKTWTQETRLLWPQESALRASRGNGSAEDSKTRSAGTRKVGRPKGSRDKKQRARRYYNRCSSFGTRRTCRKYQDEDGEQSSSDSEDVQEHRIEEHHFWDRTAARCESTRPSADPDPPIGPSPSQPEDLLSPSSPAWLDALPCSLESDPFRDDWPHW